MKALIPSRHLQDMTHITQAREVWKNSKLVKNESEEVFSINQNHQESVSN